MKNKILLSIVILFIFISVNPIYGETAETQEQDGKSIAFQLVESSPVNLSKDVKLNTEIKLLFNKNVVNMTVKENNSKCIKLLDENNNIVASELIFPDDQIEPDRKREIIIKPVNILNENTSYKIEISSNFQAKNGSLLGNTVLITFITLKNEKIEESINELPKDTTNQNNIENKNSEVLSNVKNTYNVQQSPSQENSNNNSETISESNNLNKETEDSSTNSLSNDTSNNSNISSPPTDEQRLIKSDNDGTEVIEEETNNNQNNNYILLLVVIILLTAIFIFIKFKKRTYEK